MRVIPIYGLIILWNIAILSIPAPSNPIVIQSIENNILIDTITFDPVIDPYIDHYNIYCTIDDPLCAIYHDCDYSCSFDVPGAVRLGFVPAEGPYLFVHPYRCPHVIYRYCITSVDIQGHESNIPATTVVSPIDVTPSCQDLVPNTLTRIQEICHGAPVRSVAWLCATSCPPPINCSCTGTYILPRPIAAVGGFISHALHVEGSSLQIYQMNILNEQLTETAHANPTNYVLAVDFCCIDGVAYLAVGGTPNQASGYDVWIYRYDIDSHQLTLISHFTHGSTVNAVSWLCQDCSQPGIAYLAIGGQCGDSNIRILRFDAHCPELTLVTSRSFNAPVLSLDWCVIDKRTPLLLVGGKTAINDCGQKYNLIIYSSNCTGGLNAAGTYYYEGGTVRSAKWCCDIDKHCTQTPVFAVAGRNIEHPTPCNCSISNIQLFVYNPLSNKIKPIASLHQPGKVFVFDWIPGCHCTHFTVGSGCLHERMCEQNIYNYQIIPGRCSKLLETSSALFDDTISSLKWCKFGTCSYLLAGSEHAEWQDHECHQACANSCEVVLYKAQFCQEPLPPQGICNRRSIDFLAEEEH